MGIVIFLLISILIIVITVGVQMDQAKQNVLEALAKINATIARIQPSAITAEEVQSVADSINAANAALNTKFPA